MSWRNQNPTVFRAMSASRKPIRILKANQEWQAGFNDAMADKPLSWNVSAEYRKGYLLAIFGA